MKRAILTTAAFLATSIGLQAQSKIENQLLQYNDTRAIVTFDLQTENNNIPSNRKEVIKPYLYNGKDTVWLDAVEVYGKNRIKRERQENALKGERGWELKENQTVKGITYSYSSETKVKRWMTPAHLGIKREIVGCAQCNDGMADETVASQQMYFEPAKVERRIPAEFAIADVSDKIVLEDDRYKVIFKVGKIDIDHNIFNNAESFENILGAIDKIYTYKDFKVEKIEITGHASPEGTQYRNKWLGENRAKALINYIIQQRPQYNLTPDNFQIVNGEENWAGLRSMTLESQMSDEEKKKIIDIIDSDKGAARKLDLRALDGGRTFQKMLKEVYPHLRTALYLTVYYGNSDSRAVENINLANSLIRKGEYAKALETVAPYSEDFRAYNTYAVALMMNKEFEKALPYLEKAKAEGHELAEKNRMYINAELQWEQEKNRERDEYIRRFE